MPIRIWYFRKLLLHTHMAQTLLWALGPRMNTHDESEWKDLPTYHGKILQRWLSGQSRPYPLTTPSPPEGELLGQIQLHNEDGQMGHLGNQEEGLGNQLLFYRWVCRGPEKPGNWQARRPISSQACPRAGTPCSRCRRRQGLRLSQQAVVRPLPGSNHCCFSKPFQVLRRHLCFGQENPKRPP